MTWIPVNSDRRSKPIRRALTGAALAVSLGLAATQANALPVTQLGFALDSSGSISGAEYALQVNGLAQALAALPTNSTVEVTVVEFGTNAFLRQSPLVIDSPATRTALVNTVNALPKTGGATNMSAAINILVAAMTGSANFADPGSDALINLSTDGVPTTPGNARALTVAAAQAALAAGIDALTSEAVGNGTDLPFLQSLVFNPQGGLGTGVTLPVDSAPPNPLTAANAWVVPVSDFNAYASVIGSKVRAIVPPDPPSNVPEPGMLTLLGSILFGLYFVRRRKAVA